MAGTLRVADGEPIICCCICIIICICICCICSCENMPSRRALRVHYSRLRPLKATAPLWTIKTKHTVAECDWTYRVIETNPVDGFVF